jgi:hypothetical protein
LLVERGALSPDDRCLLDDLVERRVKKLRLKCRAAAMSYEAPYGRLPKSW